MEIKVGFELSYFAVNPTPMVTMLNIHPSRFADIVGTERITAEPDVPIGFYRDGFGNVCGRLVAPAGGVTLRGDALVRDSGLPDAVVPTAQQLPIDQLPDELLLYLMPSRYCETDKLTDIAWSLFGNTRPGVADLEQRPPRRAQRVGGLAVEAADGRVQQLQFLQPLERLADLVAGLVELVRDVARGERESRRQPRVQLEHAQLVAA